MATTAAAAKAPADIAPPAPKSHKLLLIVAAVLFVLAIGGGAAWYFLGRAHGDDQDAYTRSRPAVFLPIDQFTVNLQPEDAQQFLQVSMTLKVVDDGTVDAIKALLPEVRSRILLLLSSKRAAQLSTPEGKTALAEAIIREVEAPLQDKPKAAPKARARSDSDDSTRQRAKADAKPRADGEEGPRRVLAVYFTHFIIQ
jgi:flagellar FliL protein